MFSTLTGLFGFLGGGGKEKEKIIQPHIPDFPKLQTFYFFWSNRPTFFYLFMYFWEQLPEHILKLTLKKRNRSRTQILLVTSSVQSQLHAG